jgi:hypothetical protein
VQDFVEPGSWSRHWLGPYDVRCPECWRLGGPCANAKPDRETRTALERRALHDRGDEVEGLR